MGSFPDYYNSIIIDRVPYKHKNWQLHGILMILVQIALFSPHTGFDNLRTSRKYVCVLLLAYAWFWARVRWHIRKMFAKEFLKFSNFYGSSNVIPFENLLQYIWPLIYHLYLKEPIHNWFKKTLFFNFSYKLLNKHFSLPQSTCQIRMSVRK